MARCDEFQLQWYPGHMAKARRRLEERLRSVDFLIEVADARAPLATRNPELDSLAGRRPRLLLLLKGDLADPQATRAWQDVLEQAVPFGAMALSLRDPDAPRRVRGQLRLVARRILSDRRSPMPGRMAGVAMPRIGQAQARGMVVGIPNTGKSSLIRLLGGRAATGDRPGVTRGMQEFRVDPEVLLVDTPGLLWPRSSRGWTALCLAWLGCAGERAYDAVAAATLLVLWLRTHRAGALSSRYALEEERLEPRALLEQIARARGRARPGESEAAIGAEILLREFRTGALGTVTLELPRAQKGAADGPTRLPDGQPKQQNS